MNLNVENITVGLENKTILHNVSLTVRSGEFVGLIGPNGSGKSTLLKSIYRVLKPYSGLISLDDDNVYQLSARQNAQRMAVVRQESSVEFDFTVMEIVMMGRSPHKRLFQTDTTADSRICEESLERVGMQAYAERSFFLVRRGKAARLDCQGAGAASGVSRSRRADQPSGCPVSAASHGFGQNTRNYRVFIAARSQHRRDVL